MGYVMNDLLIVTTILAGSTCGVAISALYYSYKYNFLKKDYDALKKEKTPKMSDSEALRRFMHDISSGEGMVSISYIDPTNIYYHRR